MKAQRNKTQRKHKETGHAQNTKKTKQSKKDIKGQHGKKARDKTTKKDHINKGINQNKQGTRDTKGQRKENNTKFRLFSHKFEIQKKIDVKVKLY